MARWIKPILSVVLFIWVVAALPLFALAVILSAVAETAGGRLAGLSALTLLPLPALLCLLAWSRWRRHIGTAIGLLSVAGASLLIACLLLSPTGRSRPSSGIRSVYAKDAAFHRASPANLVPEIDQLKLATYVLPFLEGSTRTRHVFLGVYRDMAKSRDFEALGSVLGEAYSDLLLGCRTTGHFYEYIPPGTPPDARLPVILFIHGSFGNFRGYMWVWKAFADQNHWAVIAPTFGSGNWDKSGGLESIDSVRQYCLSHPRLDGRRIILAGLSNGGRGALLSAAATPDAYEGLILLSPVLDDGVLSSPEFAAQWQRKPILVLEGTADTRIPLRYVQDGVRRLSDAGLEVTARYVDGEDHFLVFSDWNRVSTEMAAWMASSGLQSPPESLATWRRWPMQVDRLLPARTLRFEHTAYVKHPRQARVPVDAVPCTDPKALLQGTAEDAQGPP